MKWSWLDRLVFSRRERKAMDDNNAAYAHYIETTGAATIFKLSWMTEQVTALEMRIAALEGVKL